MNIEIPEGFTLDTPVSGNSVPDGFVLDTPQQEKLPEGFTLDAVQPKETSTMGALARSAATNILPTAGALAGGSAGAEIGAGIGSFAGPVGTVIGGIVGGLAGGLGGGKLAETAQEKIAETVAPDAWKQVQQLRGADQQNHPYITTAGALVPFAITHKFSPQEIPSVVNAGRKLIGELSSKPLNEAKELLAQEGSKETLNKLMNMAVGSGFMGGSEAWNQIQTGDFSPIKLAISTIGGASFTTPRGWTPKILGGAEQQNTLQQSEPETSAKVEQTVGQIPAPEKAITDLSEKPITDIAGTISERLEPIPETIRQPEISPAVMEASRIAHEQVAAEEQAARNAGLVVPDTLPQSAVAETTTPLTSIPQIETPATAIEAKSDLANLKGNVGGSGTTEEANKVRDALLKMGENLSGIAGGKGKPIESAIPIEKRTLSQHVDEEMNRAKREGLDSLDQTLTGLKAGWNYWKELLTQPPRDDGLSQAISKHEGQYSQTETLATKFLKEKSKEVGGERRLAAIAVFADAGGNANVLAQGLKEAPHKEGKQAYADALKLNEKEKQVAIELQRFQQGVGEELEKRGLLKLAEENYFRRIFKVKNETDFQAIINKFLNRKAEDVKSTTDQTANIDKSAGSIAMARQFKRDYEAMRFVDALSKETGNKYEVELNAFKRTMDYWITAQKTLADIKFIDDLKISRQRDKRLSVITQEDLNAFKNIGEKDTTKTPYQNFQKYLADAKAELNARNKSLDKIITEKRNDLREDAELAIKDSEAKLAKAQGLYDLFRGASKDENFKQPDLRDYSLKVYDGLGTVWVHPKALPQVKSMYELSALRKSAAMAVSSDFKQAMLSFSMFHPVQLAIHGLEHRVNPFNLVKELDFSGNSDLSRTMISLSDAGLIHNATAELNALMEGVSGGGGLFSRIPMLGEALAKVNRLIFEDFHPRLKMTMALHALERNRLRYAKDLASGKMSDYQLRRLTAEQANAAFGGINYKLLGRNPTFQDTLRLTLLAPDFLEARTRFVAQALTKYGGEQRAALALGAATLYTVARIANLLIDGRPHLEKENMFSIVYQGKAYSLRTLQGDILHAITHPGQFVLGRVNPVTLKPILEAATGRDFFGRERTAGQQAKDLITAAVPISMRGLMPDAKREEGVLQIIGSAFGFGAKRYQETAEIYKKVNDWKKANNIIPRGEFIYDPDKDPYRGIKLALADGNTADAIAGIRDALNVPQVGPVPKSDAEKLMQLTNHFYKYATSPFTGSKLNEFYFVKTLNGEDRAAYREAKDEKLKIFREFLKARNTFINERNKPIAA